MIKLAPLQRLHDIAGMKLWHWGIIALGFGLAIWLIIRIRAYFREDAEDADQTLKMLTQFRELHQEGGLSDDEFRLIRSRLANDAQGALGAGKAKSSAISADSGVADLANPRRDISTDSTEKHTTEDDDVTTSGMRDEETG